MRTTLAHDTHLVGAACNPCMDLVAMVGCDRAPPAAASAPPGLTPAQLAMRQRVLAMQARRMGVANPTAASGSQGVRRGPTLQLVVWRMGSAPSCVWAVPIEPPRPEALHDADECVSVLDLCWSPDGERLALRLALSHTSSQGHTQHALALQIYSVYDGTVVHTHHALCDVAPHRSFLQWIAIDAPSTPSQALDMLAQLPALAPLHDPTDDRAAGRTRSLGTPRPSAGIARGTGVLAHIPALASDAPPLSLLVGVDDGGHCTVWLDGTVPLHTPDMGPGDVLSLAATPYDASLLVARAGNVHVAHVPLAWDAALVHMARLSTAARASLAHAMDAAHLAAQAWQRLVRPRCDEWRTHWEDAAARHGVDTVHEWMTLVAGGHASVACEQLLTQLTEGATLAMETDAKHGLKSLRRLAATGVRPACERLLVLLTELQGCTRWSSRYPGLDHDAVRALQAHVQTCHAVALALQEHAERELLALDEFYKWFRMEQGRQERLKLGEEAPRVVTYHDTLTVLEYLQRGFISPALDALLGSGAAPPGPPAPAAETSDDSHAPLAPLWAPVPVTYAPVLPTTAAAPSPPMDASAAVEAALAWLDDIRPPPTPTAAQWHDVHGPGALFAGPAHEFGPCTLPGDATPLPARLAEVSQALGALLRGALAAPRAALPTTHVAIPLPSDLRTRHDTVRSVPPSAPPSLQSSVPRPFVRAGAHDMRHVHTLVCKAHVMSVPVTLGERCSGAALVVGAPISLAVPARVHDVVLAQGCVHVLYGDESDTWVASLGKADTPVWPPSEAVPAPGACALGTLAHGARVVLSDDRRTITVLPS
ncbi:hypothetical protein MNAN1_000871 [Malassezia nana]|uniref:Anaphase-promoting complex subunit 4 n=1 Tax=Malassezia nana TaxID=180528 RepID=A0AAF0EI41_9BASI|nr:hypothetical protein MNAN1_000871 [Malassezia nana]